MLNDFQKSILIYINFLVPNNRYKLNYTDLQKVLKKSLNKKYSLGTLRKETCLLRSAGYIEKKIRYHKPVPILSTEGKLAISSTLPYKSYGDWDRLWRIICIQTPSSDRRDHIRFTDKLLELGFKRLQKHVYITPHALLPTAHRIATYYGIRQHCLMFETSDLRSEEQVINKAWNVDKIAKRYNNFISLSGNYLKKKMNSYWPFTAKKLEQNFIEIYSEDPHLPQELLPKSWPAEKAYQTYKKLLNSN